MQAHALRLTGTQRDPLKVGERAHGEIDSGGRRLRRAEVNLHYLVGRACANVADRATDVESSVVPVRPAHALASAPAGQVGETPSAALRTDSREYSKRVYESP